MGAFRSFLHPVFHLGIDRQYDSDLHHAANETLRMDAYAGVRSADGLCADHGFGRALGGLGPGSNPGARSDDDWGAGAGIRIVPGRGRALIPADFCCLSVDRCGNRRFFDSSGFSGGGQLVWRSARLRDRRNYRGRFVGRRDYAAGDRSPARIIDQLGLFYAGDPGLGDSNQFDPGVHSHPSRGCGRRRPRPAARQPARAGT